MLMDDQNWEQNALKLMLWTEYQNMQNRESLNSQPSSINALYHENLLIFQIFTKKEKYVCEKYDYFKALIFYI